MIEADRSNALSVRDADLGTVSASQIREKRLIAQSEIESGAQAYLPMRVSEPKRRRTGFRGFIYPRYYSRFNRRLGGEHLGVIQPSVTSVGAIHQATKSALRLNVFVPRSPPRSPKVRHARYAAKCCP